MFEEDYVMRIIKEIVRAILKLLFNIDIETPTAILLEEEEEKELLNRLNEMIDAGQINDAENLIYEMVERKDRKDLKLVLLFYSYLNEKSDEFLEEHNFSRKEVQEDLKFVLSQYGFESLVDTFLI